MRLVRFLAQGRPLFGVLEGDAVDELDGDFFSSGTTRSARHSLSSVTLLAPCTPSKVVAVGLNYRDHAGELGMTVPDNPVIFLKPSTTVAGPGDAIRYPRMSGQVDYEAELGVVIRDRVKNI